MATARQRKARSNREVEDDPWLDPDHIANFKAALKQSRTQKAPKRRDDYRPLDDEDDTSTFATVKRSIKLFYEVLLGTAFVGLLVWGLYCAIYGAPKW
eukprot:CAMPEP_0197867678 /NCGR_PEP_ID=MMETSP1438-20131217/44882_1 /TAXON_ID=1461541 /ORGANISM="Pterosperma sp., Strain CCMP1384" /LENGTH=97 /DNA_ID=CAMNT_0043486339 /DNA_START=115 /DNA_END=408 /DNA_ORIENTATION=+